LGCSAVTIAGTHALKIPTHVGLRSLDLRNHRRLTVRLFNTLTQSLEPFHPQGTHVGVYVCGITPYDTTHLGHAFTYAWADILVRTLEHMGHLVRYVQNVTDIDDDILRKAKELGQDWRDVVGQWTTHFIRDLIELNVRPPDHYPKATEMIPEIIRSVQCLMDAGVAYVAGGSVYFDLAAWPDFGKLSSLLRGEMLPLANQRGNRPDDPHKHDPLDFVLWQAQAPGEPAWESPWGPGRPGWHIECSTMSRALLGGTVDIHGGGADLVFPHHECELAQVEPCNRGTPFVRLWMHTAMVRHQGEKMSKSLGNLVMVRELLKDWSADGIRLYLAAHHYRAPWEHNPDELGQAQSLARKISRAATTPGGARRIFDAGQARSSFIGAMQDDLNAPAAIAVLEKLAEDTLVAADNGRRVADAQSTLRSLSSVLGLRLDTERPEARVVEGWETHLERFVSEKRPKQPTD